jgi:hypothetical protein
MRDGSQIKVMRQNGKGRYVCHCSVLLGVGVVAGTTVTKNRCQVASILLSR